MLVKSKLIPAVALILSAQVAATSCGPSQLGYPNSSNVHQVTWFGERPSWSPDGKKIAYMSKTFGDAMELDLASGHSRMLTQWPHVGFLRAQYLPNGDYILIGPKSLTRDSYEDTRWKDQQLWVLIQNATKAIPLNQSLWEGVAISRTKNKIAWVNNWQDRPDLYQWNESVISTADIVYSETDGSPSLVNKRQVIHYFGPNCNQEPQDFRLNDTELLFTCYNRTVPQTGSVNGINMETGAVTQYRFVEGEYNEVEGTYASGDYSMVESNRDQAIVNGSMYLDIWRLRLDQAHSPDFKRITYFGTVPGWKASNPVVSPDGKTMAFQSGRGGDAPGVGYGVFLLDLAGYD